MTQTTMEFIEGIEEPQFQCTGRRSVFRAIRKAHNGLTMDEISHSIPMKIQTVCYRMRDLRRLGLVTDSGEKRLTRGGRKAIVWMVA